MDRMPRIHAEERRHIPVVGLVGTSLTALAFAVVTGASLGLLLAAAIEWCLAHVVT
jgi:hypothetical protein